MNSHLIIPDPHNHPDHNNDRFEWVSSLILDLKPTHVICIGDWADLPSLCSYDKGTQGFEGRRYVRDIAHNEDALEKFHNPLRKRKKKQPKKWMLHGNHEYRIERAISVDAVHLDGIISVNDLNYREYGWEVVPYNGSSPGISEIDGIAYSHFFTSGVMGRPIGGEHPAYQMLTKQYVSSVQGHTHTTDYCVRSDPFGNHVQSLVCGCFIDYFAEWAGEANKMWWRGVVYLTNVSDGQYDPQWISLDAIKKAYK